MTEQLDTIIASHNNIISTGLQAYVQLTCTLTTDVEKRKEIGGAKLEARRKLEKMVPAKNPFDDAESERWERKRTR